MSDLDQLLDWFARPPQNGSVDVHALAFVDLPGSGRGAVALKDLPKGFTLFTIPRDLTLSVRTSTVRSRFGERSWRQFGLHKGWTGLILSMMYEESLGSMSKWHPYLSSLPTTFDTPMFWNEEDLAELKGTAIVDKIGKVDAERDFYETLIPAVRSRPDLFPPYVLDKWYTRDQYHIMGSRILSRSFQLEYSHGMLQTVDPDGEGTIGANTSSESAMDIDQKDPSEGDDDASSTDSDAEQEAEICMVPMADMLNARYGCNNARLFDDDPVELSMITTKPIKAREQIWNTYGDLPNSDLLRRYGHVDLVPLPTGQKVNPADIVEVPANLVVSATLSSVTTDQSIHVTQSSCQERIDWWLDEAGDDTFVIETDSEIPHPLISFVRLLLLSTDDWTTARSKEKLPKPKLDDKDGDQVVRVAKLAAERRLEEYPTSIQEDEVLLGLPNLSLNKQNAIIVRLGEKNILKRFVDKIGQLENNGKAENKKRKNGNSEEGKAKKSKR